MSFSPEHINDWLCSSRVQTDISQQELMFRSARHFMPDVLAQRRGGMNPHVRGAVFIVFELVQLRFDDAQEEAQTIIDVALDQSHLKAHVEPYSIDIRPLKNPNPDILLPDNVIQINWYRR